MWCVMNADHYASTRFLTIVGLLCAVIVALFVGPTLFPLRSCYGTFTSVQTLGGRHGQSVDNVGFKTNTETFKLEK